MSFSLKNTVEHKYTVLAGGKPISAPISCIENLPECFLHNLSFPRKNNGTRRKTRDQEKHYGNRPTPAW